MYGSSLMLVTRMLRDSRIAARDAAAMPFPREETTPPVTKTYLAIYLGRVGMEKFTGTRPLPQTSTRARTRSEEHTSELQSPCNLVCRLLLEKNNTTRQPNR